MSIKAAVIGDPIEHSLSPIIHEFFLQKHGISGSYEKKKITSSQLDNEINKMIEDGFAGFNVTIPHKEKIFKKCSFLSKSASLTKAVNTVVITKDKKLFGHNSDANGFIDNLKYHFADFVFDKKPIFVIGSGGAARAIIYGLIKNGSKKIHITNRSELRAKNLINDFKNFADANKCEIDFLKQNEFEEKLTNCHLLINTTSLGMLGQDELNIDISNLDKESYVYDIVYKPLMTNLLQQAKKQENKIITGIGMLIFQALIGFELWFKEKPNNEFVSELLNNITKKL